MVECGPGSTSRMIDADCKCHLLIEDQKLSDQYGLAVELSCRVLAATDGSQKGKVHKEFFQCNGKAVDKFYNLCEAVGLITAEQRKAAAEAEQGLTIDETRLKGHQFCAEIRMEPNMRKNPATGAAEIDPEKPGPYPRIGFRAFSVTSDKAKDVPKDPQFLAMLRQQQPAATSSQQPLVQPPAQDSGAGAGMNW